MKNAPPVRRVTKADKRHAGAVVDELHALNAERDRLTRDGLASVAAITDIRQNIATTALVTWHELVWRCTSRIAIPTRRHVGSRLNCRRHLTFESALRFPYASIRRIVRRSWLFTSP